MNPSLRILVTELQTKAKVLKSELRGFQTLLEAEPKETDIIEQYNAEKRLLDIVDAVTHLKSTLTLLEGLR